MHRIVNPTWATPAFLWVLLMASSTRADTVVLRDGQTLTGTISGETPASVTIDAANGRFTFPRKNILRATRESPIENQKRQLERYLQEGKLDSAVQLYAEPDLQAAIPSAVFNGMILTTLSDTANGVTATSQTAGILASRWQTDTSAAPELLLLAAALNMDYNQSLPASKLLQRVEANPPKDFTWPSSTVSALLERVANAALKFGDGNLLALTASLASRLPLQPGSSSGVLSQYSSIATLIRHKDYLQASTLFRPEYFLHRADLFVPLGEQLVTSLLANFSNNANLAALQSASVTVVPYLDKDLQERALKRLVAALYDTGKVSQAQSVTDKASQTHPDLGALLQHLLEFKKRKNTLSEEQRLEKYKLAAWAKSMGLLDESRALFLTLRPDPRFAETVNLQLTIIENSQAQKEIDRIRAIYDRGNFIKLKAEAAIFLRTSPPEKFEREAKDLLQLAEFEKWSAGRSSSNQAEAEFQQAERLFQRGELDGALLQLNRLQLDRQDSGAAQKADNLRDRIMREKIRMSRLGQTTRTL